MHELNARYFPGGGPIRIEEDTSSITPLVDGEEYFGAVRMEIGRAQSPGDAIYMLGWRFESNFRFSGQSDDVSELGTVLAQKAAAGVDVRIIMPVKWQLLSWMESNKEKDLRSTGNSNLHNLLDWFGPQGNVLHARLLRNTPVGRDQPLSGRVLLDSSGELFGIHHQKMVIVVRNGAAVGFVSGLDFVGVRLDSSRHDESLPRTNATNRDDRVSYYWHDAGARVEGPAVQGLFYVFNARWVYCAGLSVRSFKLADGLHIPALNPRIEITAPLSRPKSTPLSSKPAVTGVFLAANFPERDVKGSNPAHHEPHGLFAKPALHTTGILYKKAIAAARKYIYIEDQYFNGPSLEPALSEAARRNVRIIAVMGGYNDDARKAVEPALANPFLKALGKDAVAVMHVKNTVVHSKLMIIDDEFVALGSTNFSDRSLIEAEDRSEDGALADDAPESARALKTLRGMLRELNQVWCTDSELTVAAVDDRSGDLNVARRLRVLLWAEHLRVSPFDQAIWRQLADLGTGLSVFNKMWGKPVTFDHSNSRLVTVKIL